MANENLDRDDILLEESKLSGKGGDLLVEAEGFVVGAHFEDLEDVEDYDDFEDIEGFESLEGVTVSHQAANGRMPVHGGRGPLHGDRRT